ncbi:MAG: LysM peptidoglycan-binding domain-containing protein [Chloroflexi bacterium]|nr:LysM peptidoglycan-binding domain-containing protein [Chloroflexota bacterium]
MKESRGCTRPSLVMGLLFGFLALIAFGAALAIIYFRQQAQAQRAQFAPPVVIVSEPVSGAYVPAGTHLSVSATAFGKSPITRVELWANGELKETQESVRPEGDSTFYAHFALLIPSEGAHFLTVHAVNALGIIGKSLPVGILGTTRTASGEILQTVQVNPDETLEDIAKKYGSDAETLQKLNPPLKGQQPAAGANIVVPIIPGQVPALPNPPPPPPPIVLPPTMTGPMLQLQPKTGGIDKFLDMIPLFGLALIAPPAPPAAPTNIQGQVDGCDVTLSWTDMAKDETRYEVWALTLWMGVTTPWVVANLQPSPAQATVWYRFRTPQTGYVSFWVEAVNSGGKQPSNSITLYIDPKNYCGWEDWSQIPDSYLIVQVYEMRVQGNYEKVYCYTSFENSPEQRIPEDPSIFIPVQGGKADFRGMMVGTFVPAQVIRLIPIPQDGALDIKGKCLAWSGGNLIDLEGFSGTYAKPDWDGARRTVKGASYEIEFAIKPYSRGAVTAMFGSYSYEDPTLQAPFYLHIEKPGGTTDPREYLLSWKWVGDPKSINGFLVYLDEVRYKYVSGASTQSTFVVLPDYCGRTFRWQVTAVSSSDVAQSRRYYGISHKLPECPIYATVKFETYKFKYIDDSDSAGPPAGPCDTAELNYNINVNGTRKSFGRRPYEGEVCKICYKSTDCGPTYTFNDSGLFFSTKDLYPDTILVPISTENIAIDARASSLSERSYFWRIAATCW